MFNLFVVLIIDIYLFIVYKVGLFIIYFTPHYVFAEHSRLNNIEYDFNPVEQRILNFSNCPLCHIENMDKKHINSTSRDCLITFAVKNVDNVFPFIRSLRTTGCKASVFILFDDESFKKFSNDTFTLFKNCSINIQNIGSFPYIYKPDDLFAYRHIYIYDFIYKMASFFDRILLADLYDSVFQNDPFFEDVDPDAFTVTREARFMHDDYHNKLRVSKVMYYNDETMGHIRTLNAGIMYGSPEMIMKYQNLYFHEFNLSNIKETHRTCDQGYLNYFQLRRVLKPSLGKLNIWYNDQGFETLASILPHLPKCLQLGNVTLHNTRQIIVHQFDRSNMLIAMVILSCPKGNYSVYPNSYTRIHKGDASIDKIQQFLPEPYTN